MTYTAQCERCGDAVGDAFLMCQFHEDEFMTTPYGDRLKQHGYSLADVTFCANCTIALLLDHA